MIAIPPPPFHSYGFLINSNYTHKRQFLLCVCSDVRHFHTHTHTIQIEFCTRDEQHLNNNNNNTEIVVTIS